MSARLHPANTSKNNLLHAIYTGPLGPEPAPTDPADYEFAGVIGMINSSWEDMVSEPGWIQILTPFQVSTFSFYNSSFLCIAASAVSIL